MSQAYSVLGKSTPLALLRAVCGPWAALFLEVICWYAKHLLFWQSFVGVSTNPLGNGMPSPTVSCKSPNSSLFAICFLLVPLRPSHLSHATSLMTILTRLQGKYARGLR